MGTGKPNASVLPIARSESDARHGLPRKGDEPRTVLAVGGGNAEKIFTLREPLKEDGKLLFEPKVTAGGSAVNHSCRLLAAGDSVTTVIPAADDEDGRALKEELERAARRGGGSPAVQFVGDADARTSLSTILVRGPNRAILGEQHSKMLKAFQKHLILQLDAFRGKLNAVMIGHIHADRQESPGCAGALTRHVIDWARGLEDRPFLFANFGGSQYRMGAAAWQFELEHLDCLQMDVSEMRTFCKSLDDNGEWSVQRMLQEIGAKCTVIITLERMGAVARLKGSDTIYDVWPYQLKRDERIDTTGAGDAFGAGVVHGAPRTGGFTSGPQLVDALEVGRLWGAMAIRTFGGANEAPTLGQIAQWKRCHAARDIAEIKLADAGTTLDRLDAAFPVE